MLFVGSGVSNFSGLPTWVQLVRSLIIRARAEELINDEERSVLFGIVDKRELDYAADLLQESIGIVKISDFLFEEIAWRASPHEIHRDLTVLPFSAIVTTNFDNLLERAFIARQPKIHGSNEPRQRHALILIDEIDAHMHPRWQQSIIHHLQEIFPNIQVIASAHSPLVVAGRSAEEVTIFSRNQETGKIAARRASISFKGMRADQILTSQAFGLDAARDYDTSSKLSQYRALLEKGDLTETEQQDLNGLRSDDTIMNRSVAAAPLEAGAYEVLSESIDAILYTKTPEQRAELSQEIEFQLREARLGSKMTARPFDASRIYAGFDLSKWRGKAAAATARAVSTRSRGLPHVFEDALWKALKPYLAGYFHGRCAYCEANIVSTDFGHVEHYIRPRDGSRLRTGGRMLILHGGRESNRGEPKPQSQKLSKILP